MPDRSKMYRWIRKVAGPALLLAAAALALSACGSGSETTTTTERPAVSAATADRLAELSDRIATQLDDGDLCHAAHTADDLQSAVDDSDLPANIRPGVDQVTGELVDEVNCPAPPPPPEPEPKPKKPEDSKDEQRATGPAEGHGNGHEGGHGNGHGNGEKPEPPGSGGLVPPGQAKQKGGGD
jgi:hypothetical protein